MKYKSILIAVSFLVLLTAAKSDRPAYRIYTAKGHSSEYGDVLKAAMSADVVFFGESHTNPIAHWLELQLLKDLCHEKKGKVILGTEIFERDNQLLISEYSSGLIRKKDFEAEAKLWPNYKTDYAPIIDFAVKNKVKIVATNIPRRFASVVNLKGLEGLDSINGLERGMMAPLPLKYNPNLACYKNLAEMFAGSDNHQSDNLPKAQAIKDATMAHFILKNIDEENTFFHFNGSYHSENSEGIVWYLKEYNKRNATDLKVVTITCVDQDDVSEVEKDNLGKADFIIVIPDDMIQTQPPSPAPAGPAMAKPSMPPMNAMKQDTTKKDSVQEGASGGEDDDD
jgi:uncharacterized iron-regulated protein